MLGIGIVLSNFIVSDCSASDSPGGGQRVISDGTPRPSRRHRSVVLPVPGVGWGEHNVPAAQAVPTATLGPSALLTRIHDR